MCEFLGMTVKGAMVNGAFKMDDPEFVSAVKEEYGENVRFMRPGFMYTQEMRFGRTNIHINEHGVVTDVTTG